MNTVDWVILAVLALGAVAGFRRGLMGMLISLGGTLLAAYAASRYAAPAARWLEENWQWQSRLARSLENRLPLSADMRALPLEPWPGEALRQVLQSLRLPNGLAAQLEQTLATWRPEVATVDTLGELVAWLAARLLVSAVVVYLLFVGLRLLVRLVEPLLTTLLTPGPLAGINRLLGAAAGTATQLVWLSLVIGALVPAIAFAAPPDWLEVLGQSSLVRWLIDLWQLLAVWLVRAVSIY